MTLGFCLGFRNWHLLHLQRCLQSIRRHSDASIAVTDLGTDEEQIRHVRRAVAAADGRLLCEQAPEWSRSRALNLAAQHIGTPDWLVFTDADMLFPASWFQAVHDWVDNPGTLWLTRSRDLDEPTTTVGLRVNALFPHKVVDGDAWLYAHSAPHGNDLGQGGAMVVPRAWFQRVGGFDEYYSVWGAEDNDLVLRAGWDGLETRWLPDAWVAHQWHDRTWPTPAQFAQVRRNREYLYQRIVDRGPIVRNQRTSQ